MYYTFNFIGSVSEQSVSDFISTIENIKTPINSITINISSLGGGVTPGITMYNYLKNKQFNIITHNLGEVSSAALLIYLGGKIRTAEDISKFMLHPITICINESSTYYKVQEILNGVEADIQNYYYENSATVTWKTYDSKTGMEIEGAEKIITYQMLFRSPGKAKEGHCLFVKKELHKKIFDYLTMGLWNKMKNEKGAKIVEMSAYAPLITATAIDYISIPMENIFVLKDEKVSIMKKAVTVKTKDVEYTRKEFDFARFDEYINQFGLTFYKKKSKENKQLKLIKRSKKDLEAHGIDIDVCPKKDKVEYKKECYCDRKNEKSEISNILWDGMGLIDSSIFPDNMEGFIYCRSHFFKSCLFKGNIQDYFREYYGANYESAYETDMTGRKHITRLLDKRTYHSRTYQRK